MSNPAQLLFLNLLSFLLGIAPGMCQIFTSDSDFRYHRVFEDTDNFGASYLSILEDSLPALEEGPIKYAVWNDLAYYSHTRNLRTAVNHALNARNAARLAGDTLWEGRIGITLGAILLRMEELDSAQTILKDVEGLVSEADLPLLYTQLGYVYERRGQLDRASDYALKALQISGTQNDRKGVALAYSDLSNIFWKQGKFQQALEYGLESLAQFEARGIMDLDYDFTLYVVGNCYMGLKSYEQAESHFTHALTIGERYGFYNNLSDVYISLVDLHSALGQYQKAEEAGRKALKYAQLLDNNFMVMRSWLSIGKLHNLQGKYGSAVESLQRCLEVATGDFGDAYFLSQAYGELGKAYAGNHDYQNAYRAIDRYDELKEQVFTAESDRRTSLLETEFNLAEKENTIQLQKNQIKRHRTRQTLILLIIGMLILYLILLYKAVMNNRRKNRMLQDQNEEKEFLLKEIHHRIKNNLEIVSSLLALQSARMKDPNSIEAIHKSRQRIESMGLIHQKLYQGKSLSTIEMKGYFRELSDHLLSSFDESERVQITCAMEPMELNVDMAVPIGLIVNELLTNSLKYAFPGGRSGEIRVTLREASGSLFLTVSDNGVGNPVKGSPVGTGFGSHLILLLVRQLDGKMNTNPDKGLTVTFEFLNGKAA